jgi:PAS domain S-box-containing protein
MNNKKRLEHGRRPTIGYLAPSIEANPAQWWGLVEEAQKRDVNLFCFAGGYLTDPRRFQAQANVLYDLVNAENVEGVISWSSLISAYVTADENRAFHERFRSLPLVTIGGTFEGIPDLFLASYGAMYAVIVHLIETHGYCRLAFISGPEGNLYAQERYQAYADALKAHGIPLNPNLVTPPVPWDVAMGKQSMHMLLGERRLRPRVDFDAVVAASDHLLLGALEALREREIQVPRDVAGVGLDDDIPECRVSIPPFTTGVRPSVQVGHQAVETLLSLIEGEQVPGKTVVPFGLVIRQSCGCMGSAMEQAVVGPVEASSETLESVLASRRAQILSAMAQAVNESEKVTREDVERLLNSFVSELKGGTSGLLMRELDQELRQTAAAWGDVTAWQGIISAFRRQMLPYLSGPALALAEDLWQQARVAISETALRAQAQAQLRAARQAQMLREIGAALITTFDVEGLMAVLTEGLPRLGIPSCYISLYENPREPAEWSRLILAYNESSQVKLEPGGRRFRSQELVSAELWPQGRQFSYAIEPLYFQKDQLGFVLFEIGPQEGSVYETLREQISSALQGALLVQQVQEHSAELAWQKYILDTFMDNIPDQIYFKDRESRFIRISKALAQSFGLSDATLAKGKTNFDFFTEEHAQPAYEDEQRIIQTGRPIMNKEEKETRAGHPDVWVLTTKIPLHDKDGNIVGTFGISRDITERKQAEEQLERYSAELEQSNEELKRFTYIVSHDLRAPLVNLKGFAAELASALDIIRPAFVPLLSQIEGQQQTSVRAALLEDMPEALSFIEASAVRMDHFVNTLLNLSRLGRREFDLKQMDMNALVRDTLETLAHQIERRHVQVTVGPLPVVVADRTAMEQITGNILNNAIIYLEPGRVGEIEISGERNEDETIFRIRDNGRGIAPEDMDKVFAPFRRAGRQDVPGEGMGLAYVQTLVRRHGGRIWCESEPGRGTTFTFTVPHQLTRGDRNA